MAKILIAGIDAPGGHAIAAALLRNDPATEVLGMDVAPTPPGVDAGGIHLHTAAPGTRRCEDILDEEQPDAIVMVPRWVPLRGEAPLADAVSAMLASTARCGIRQFVLVGSAAIYGPATEGDLLVDEAAGAGAALQGWLREAAAADAAASRFLWRHPEVRTAILRAANLVGESTSVGLGCLLGPGTALTLPFFDPPVQVLHMDDLGDAVSLALRQKLHGTFNVAGPAPLPLGEAIRRSGGTTLPLPAALHAPAGYLLGDALRRPAPEECALERAPCTVDDSRFRAETGFEHQWQLNDIFGQLTATGTNRAG